MSQPDGQLEGQTAIVTGASAGIGEETAVELGRRGASVVVAARRKEKLDTVASTIEEAGGEALVVPTDVREEDEVAELVEMAVDEYGSIDVVVSNAGVLRRGPVEETTTDEYRAVMSTNCDGTFFCARAALPHLRESSGHFVVIGSVSGQYPESDLPIYGASKWWARGFARNLAADVGDDGVGVTVVNPAEVRTEIGAPDEPPSKERFEAGSVGEPETVAEVVANAVVLSPPGGIAEVDVYRRDWFADNF